MNKFIVFILIIIIILVVSIGIYVYQSKLYYGGKGNRDRLINQEKHIVIDGLNLLYHHYAPIDPLKGERNPFPKIKSMMASIVPRLKKKFPGNIMFVFKNKQGIPFNNFQKEEYQRLADKFKVYIYICQDVQSVYKSHASQGIDDFYASILARLYQCRILSYDKYKDFDQFMRDIGNFQVYKIAPDIREPIRLIQTTASDYMKEIKQPYTYTLEDL